MTEKTTLIPLLLVDVRQHPNDPPEIVRVVRTSEIVGFVEALRADRWNSIMGFDAVLDLLLEAVQESDPPRAKQAAG
jgi:hypothetical protein